MSRLRIAVLASGRGSNLQALIDARAAGVFDAEFAGVFSDRPDAVALQRAAGAGIPRQALRPVDFADRAAFDDAFFDAVAAVQPDLIVCAGYMRLIGERHVVRFADRMINIHPSLLPAHPGLHTHRRALEDGVRRHGASVHYVIPAVDAGPVLAQAAVDVRAGDTPDSLGERVLAREHVLLPACVALIAGGRLRYDGGRVVLDGAPLTRPLQLDSDDRLTPAA
ncbi:phosphoribosylglycinamide formyltransferase [Coralloluteibacterium stylophorae]|uniref:Phosphoribosylglycinamide formyltransferase n=1 Tax=Coralloluteibacterium stylophorae TaxID=1776034 RepID=A0A8J8AZ91_9GAMM|nr:phosphoribosylglycinamide formyltransferase [Coralloluteibacterium stylophorae]MBS7456731.1 phosphoribosylglycinamide formyltransferase [Coralloluteibacterium stylophorae]